MMMLPVQKLPAVTGLCSPTEEVQRYPDSEDSSFTKSKETSITALFVAERMNWSESTVRRIHAKALKEMERNA